MAQQDEFVRYPQDARASAGVQDAPADVDLRRADVCGIPSRTLALDGSDHEALERVAAMGEGDVVALHAQRGTNWMGVALAALSSSFVASVLAGERPRTSLCVGTEEDLRELVRTLQDRPHGGQSALHTRWIPRIAHGVPTPLGGTSGRRILGPLRALCLLHADDVSAADSGGELLVRGLEPEGEGASSEYAEPWYVRIASTHFLDCVLGFLHERPTKAAAAAEVLLERLRAIDQDRRELADAYEGVIRARGIQERLDELEAQTVALRREHVSVKRRLNEWEDVRESVRPRRFGFGRAHDDQTDVILTHAYEGEALALGETTLDDVCEAYGERLDEVATRIDALHATSLELTEHIIQIRTALEAAHDVVERLVRDCGLDEGQAALLDGLLETGPGSPEASHGRLAEVLDRTVLPAQFWLAVHVREAQWLALCADSARGEEAGTVSPDALCGLFPFQLARLLDMRRVLEAIDAQGSPRDELLCLRSDTILALRTDSLRAQCRRLLCVGTVRSCGPAEARGAHATPSLFSWACAQETSREVFLQDAEPADASIRALSNELFPEEPHVVLKDGSAQGGESERAHAGAASSIFAAFVRASWWQRGEQGVQNRVEANAVASWLAEHLDGLCARHGADGGTTVLVTTPFAAQAELMRSLLHKTIADVARDVEVCALADVPMRTWPVVVAAATCGPKGLAACAAPDLRHILGIATDAATAELVVFLAAAWETSDDECAMRYLAQADRVAGYGEGQREDATEAAARRKPLTITALVTKLCERGELSRTLSSPEANAALRAAGLIERLAPPARRGGWKPTDSGRDVGIVPAHDKTGRSFCAYTAASEPIVADVLASAAN